MFLYPDVFNLDAHLIQKYCLLYIQLTGDFIEIVQNIRRYVSMCLNIRQDWDFTISWLHSHLLVCHPESMQVTCLQLLPVSTHHRQPALHTLHRIPVPQDVV